MFTDTRLDRDECAIKQIVKGKAFFRLPCNSIDKLGRSLVAICYLSGTKISLNSFIIGQQTPSHVLGGKTSWTLNDDFVSPTIN